MVNASLHGVLHYLGSLRDAQALAEASDAQLLAWFARRHEEAPFAALVRRHGPMVWSVARRVLTHVQDAEDVFQATFLLLARKAASIRKAESVGSWLHGVAHRLALKARLQQARRRTREKRAADMRPTTASDETSLAEVLAALDGALGGLPEKYRAALVLCYLEGHTQEEAARRLGCPLATVRTRLARGRKLLRDRLVNRGLTLSTAGLAALLIASAAPAAAPAVLVKAVVQAALAFAAGQSAAALCTAQAAGLVKGGLQAMALTKLKTATMLLLAVSLIATGAGVLAHQALADKPAPPRIAGTLEGRQAARPTSEEQPERAEAEEAKEMLLVAGRVLGPKGQPIAGARLYSPGRLKDRPQGQDDRAVIQRGTTGKDGRFQLKLPRRDAQPAPLIAAADGFGLDWVELPPKDAPGDLTLRLVKDVTIHGRILSTEGKPILGATVQVDGVIIPRKLDDFLKALERGWRAAETLPAKQLSLPLTQALRVTASDKDGRFEVAGVGAERLVGLKVKNATATLSELLVVTHEGLDVKAINQAIARSGRGAGLLYGPALDLIVEPTRRIEGTVREAGTGKPVAGATVQGAGSTAVTDAHGRYRLFGLRKAQQYSVNVTPPVTMPLIGRWQRVSDVPASLEPLRADVELPRGVIVTGRVLDKETGKGVQSSVSFMLLPDHPFAGKAAANLSLYASTDRDGRYRLVTLPGPGVLRAQVVGTRETVNGVRVHPYPLNRYKLAEFTAEDRARVPPDLVSLEFANACKVLDVKEDGGAVTCDLMVDPGKMLTVNLEDPAGKPLTGAIAAGTSAMEIGALSLKSAACPVYALDPRKPRQLVLLHPQRHLAAVVRLRGDEKDPLTVRLGPAAVLTGRLLDMDGQPIRGAQVAALYSGQVGRALVKELTRRGELPQADANGRFRLEAIVPGLKFDLGFFKGRRRYIPEPRPAVKPLAAGQTLDLGDLRAKPERP